LVLLIQKDVVYLFEFDQLAGGNASPYCLKLETYLRMAGINFEVKMGLFAGISPRVRFPQFHPGSFILNDKFAPPYRVKFLSSNLTIKFFRTHLSSFLSSRRSLATNWTPILPLSNKH
jgi:hypothetical protein